MDAMRQLPSSSSEESLTRLGTDHLDLWQVHAVVYDNDPDLAYRTGGVIEALDKAKAQGKVRYVGFTGHKDPRIHKRMLDLGYAWDSVQFPINGFDAQFRSFQQIVLPDAVRRGIAVLGMKPFNGRGDPFHRAEVPLYAPTSATLRHERTGRNDHDYRYGVATGFASESCNRQRVHADDDRRDARR